MVVFFVRFETKCGICCKSGLHWVVGKRYPIRYQRIKCHPERSVLSAPRLAVVCSVDVLLIYDRSVCSNFPMLPSSRHLSKIQAIIFFYKTSTSARKYWAGECKKILKSYTIYIFLKQKITQTMLKTL